VQIYSDAISLLVYKNNGYTYGGYFPLPASTANRKYTFARTSTKFEVYVDGTLYYSGSGNVPTSSGKVSFIFQADDAITVQSTTAKIVSYSYLPVGCPFTA